ncbi:MAG TPA: ribosomal protein S18-alanine N-acetyltransferase [Gammaproteobacteria bacterium]
MSAVLETPVPVFRPMTDADLDQIMQIENSAYTHPWTEMIFRDCLRVGYSCWTMEVDETIIAYGVMSVVAGECHLLNLCVEPDQHNMGYGSLLLEHLLILAREHKANIAFLEVRPSNHVALHLYQQAGFDEVGMRRNYYPAIIGREDAIILARHLA